MEITKITSHILQYDLPQELGYSQQYYQKRTAHLVEIKTSDGVTGLGVTPDRDFIDHYNIANS
jgi:D-galactarolactone cycloisomerase